MPFGIPEQHLLIGVDCGQQTGIALYDPENKTFLKMITTDFWGAWNLFTDNKWWIKLGIGSDQVIFFVENPGEHKFMYKKERYHQATQRNTQEKLAFDAGGNCMQATLMIAGLRNEGFRVKAITPISSKQDAETFKRHTKYEGSTNQHVRDAGWLVYGVSWTGAMRTEV